MSCAIEVAAFEIFNSFSKRLSVDFRAVDMTLKNIYYSDCSACSNSSRIPKSSYVSLFSIPCNL